MGLHAARWQNIEQVQQANVKWLEFANREVKGGGIESRTLRPIVGNLGHFTFADSYPDMAAWSASKAAFRTPAGQAVDEGLTSLAECNDNSLYESTRQ